jgi:hypothetical protein
VWLIYGVVAGLGSMLAVFQHDYDKWIDEALGADGKLRYCSVPKYDIPLARDLDRSWVVGSLSP